MNLYILLKDIYDGKKHHRLALSYDLFMALVIMIAISITLLSFSKGSIIFENPYIKLIDLIAVILFNIDYWGGLILCNDKKAYFKRNFFDLFAIIPLNQAFILFRSFKLLQLLRVLQVFRVAGSLLSIRDEVSKFLRLNGFIYILSFTGVTITIGSIAIYFAEKGSTIDNFADAIWWTIVTTTTVGYGDISPSTNIGRIIAVILMFVGIGFIGTLTGSITSFFTERLRETREQKERAEQVLTAPLLDKRLSDLDGSHIDLSDLSDEEYRQLLNYIKFLKQQKKISSS